MHYEFASVRTHKFTRELMQDFSDQGRMPAMASPHTFDVRSGWHVS
jgi:hypothetical protein